MPKLTICIPTYNRQFWCKKTVEGIIASLKGDVELLIVDGSDNGECLKSFVEQLNDDRVRLVPPTGEFLPMMDNWNRAIKECKGEWISLIGDDDFIAPDIIDFIEMVEKTYKNVDALGWNRIPYDWPENRNNYKATPIPATYDLFPVNNKILQENYCRFVQDGQVPFGIYHAAVKRTLVDKNAASFWTKGF
jgi:glycosyltransferase involved in cell wall biosynthesis